MIARLEHRDGGPDLVDNADAFMAENAAGLTSRKVAFEDMQIGAADRRFRYLDDRIRRSRDFRLWPVFQGLLAHGLIDQRLHRWSCFRFGRPVVGFGIVAKVMVSPFR